MRIKSQSIVVGLVLVCVSACAEMWETPSKEVQYRAYSRTWVYSTVERYTKSWGFNTPHGILGIREKLEEFVYLVSDQGEKIPVHERIYALQKDNTYKKVECCSTALTHAAVYNVDNKLI